MMLVRLLYISRPDRNFSDFVSSAAAFRANNSRNGISGILVCDDNYYLQWLEGPRFNVNTLYRSLVQDERHRDIEIVDFNEVHVRQFPQWDMRCIASEDISRSILLRFMYETEFDPYQLSGAACVEFLKEVGRIAEAA